MNGAVQRLVRTVNREELLTVQPMGWTLTVAERAIRAMLRDARRWAPLETMGPIFMGGTVEGGFCVELAAPSGPNSEHQPLTTYPNVDFYNRWLRWAWSRPGLWFIGQWHTHPFQAEPIPSPLDIWGANLDQGAGWFRWNEENADYFADGGHLEIIMAAKMTRAWWITSNPDRMRLVLELPIGIAG